METSSKTMMGCAESAAIAGSGWSRSFPGAGERFELCFERLERVGLSVGFEQRHTSSLRDGVRPKRLGAVKILKGIHVEKPANRRKAKRVRGLSGLSEQLNVEAGDGLAQAIRRGLERGKTAALPGMQFVLELGKSGSLQNQRGRSG